MHSLLVHCGFLNCHTYTSMCEVPCENWSQASDFLHLTTNWPA